LSQVAFPGRRGSESEEGSSYLMSATIVNRLLQKRFWRHASSVLDVATAAGAFFLSYVTVYGVHAVATVPGIEEKTIGFCAIFVVAFWFFSMHRGSWRYVSIPDLT